MLRVREIGLSEFEALKDSWNQILQRSKDNSVFSTWEWLRCWWKHFGEDRAFRTLVAQDDGEICGFAPLMLSKYSFLGFGKLRKVEFAGCPQSDYSSFILLRRENECLRLFLEHVVRSCDWDILELVDVPANSHSGMALGSLESTKNSKMRTRTSTLCPYMTLPDSLENYVDHLSRNMRKNLRKRMQKLREDYKVEMRTQRDFDSVDNAMKAFFSLHQKRWSSKGKPGVFASETVRDFHIDVARAFDEKGWLALYFLCVNDKPVAAIYSFDYDGKKYGYLTGFDPDFESYGVGNLLKMHVVGESIRKGFREYDLARGFESYKADWSTGVRTNLAFWTVNRGFTARMYDRTLRSPFLTRLVAKLGHIKFSSS
jgi:CelD/BcsL family acetyltransferase involved in cellulose biosynthesis